MAFKRPAKVCIMDAAHGTTPSAEEHETPKDTRPMRRPFAILLIVIATATTIVQAVQLESAHEELRELKTELNALRLETRDTFRNVHDTLNPRD